MHLKSRGPAAGAASAIKAGRLAKSGAPGEESDPDQLVKTARRELINRQGRKVARECLMKIHSASTYIPVAITTARE
jgi:hypothetical protein